MLSSNNTHLFFFFKQKTAYELRISDWSSDVCSSDLVQRVTANQRQRSRSGFASGPPMVVRPKGESAMAARSARNRTLLIVKTGPKLRNIQSLKAVSAARKRAPCHRLATSAVASTASGMKKTGRLIG